MYRYVHWTYIQTMPYYIIKLNWKYIKKQRFGLPTHFDISMVSKFNCILNPNIFN